MARTGKSIYLTVQTRHGDAIMLTMVRKSIQAMTAGAGVGVVIQESIWLIGDSMTPATRMAAAMVAFQADAPWLALLMPGWLTGGAVAGLMSSMMSRSRIAGYLAALLLTLAAWLQIELTWPDPGALSAFSLVPLLGAAAGVDFGLRLVGGAQQRNLYDESGISLLT